MMVMRNALPVERPPRRGAIAASGFTLIELSIVLVIIGLLVGGVLVGRDLIHAADIRATISQTEKYNTAVNTFLSKYNCLPGDCRNASDLGFDAISNGNGDGVIGLCNSGACIWSMSGPSLAKETVNFWYHLSAAGLIPEMIASKSVWGTAGNDTPRTKITPLLAASTTGWTIQADVPFDPTAGNGGFPAHSFMMTDGLSQSSLVSTPFYAPADLYAIDAKIDDGLPFSGNVRAYQFGTTDMGGSGTYTFSFLPEGVGAGGAGAAVCVLNDVTPYQYNVQYTGSASSGLCGVVIKAAF